MDKYSVINIFIISILIVGCSPVDGTEYFFTGGTYTMCDTLCGGKDQGIGFTMDYPMINRYVDSTKNVPDIRLNAIINNNKFIGVSIVANHTISYSVLGIYYGAFHYVGSDPTRTKYDLVSSFANTEIFELPIADTVKEYQVWVIKFPNAPTNIAIFIDNVYFSAPAIVTNKDTVVCNVRFDYAYMH